MILRWMFFIVIGVVFATSCNNNRTLFKLISSDQSGIGFENILTPTDSVNVLNFEYFYNGASVSVGDFNNDGLSDLFFSGNMVTNKLYINKGDMEFQDVSAVANIENEGIWNSGAAVADVNNDGLLDIYVCANVDHDSTKRTNSLFINKGVSDNGIPVFQDMAKEFGVEELGYSQNAAFLDYDKDGDVDLYVLTNFEGKDGPSNYHPKVVDGTADNNDRLYRNNGDNTFTNVTNEAGIVYEGYGLGIAIADLNLDGWPDIFIGNDYISNDLIYINNQDGTFSNQAKDILKHQSRFSMGNDIADINNDGLVDIITLDMLPEINFRKKTVAGGGASYYTYINTEKYGYEYQYMRNMLHVNNGDAPFSEVGQMVGVHQTEWSWSPLFADVDNDGYRDLLVTNGFPKDLTDMDFINYRRDVGSFTKPSFLLNYIPELKLSNYGYKNHGNLNFTDETLEWGLSTPSYSNGAAFADLDNDGDLDYIVNNINDKVHLYENTLYSGNKKESDPNYLRVKLIGDYGSASLGAKVTLTYNNGVKQYHDHSIFRGYLSTVEDIVHFGLGDLNEVDELKVVWSDGKVQIVNQVMVDQLLQINYADASVIEAEPSIDNVNVGEYFKEISAALGIDYKHEEHDQIDYYNQRTLPHKFSQAGPGLAVGDINGDGLEDFIVGGASFFNTTIFKQNENGTFSESELVKGKVKYNEDEGLLLFDADGDQDLDLYVVSGSYEFEPNHERYQDRFYLNDGNGVFTLSSGVIPEETTSGSCVRAADFDADGDLDLFIGGRVITGSYPLSPKSYILRNDGGVFVDATSEICSGLSTAGMITDALWTDYDNNGTQDLIVVGEFMPIVIYKNTGGKLVKVENTGLENYTGWWNSINGADFDKDGDTDYIVGNLGLNNTYNISPDRPMRVYAKDFDGNGSVDPIISCYFKSRSGEMLEYPVHSWDKLSGQSPKFRDQFESYKKYGETTMQQLLQPYDSTDLLMLEANYSLTSYMENLGNGKFSLKALPQIAQIAPINGQQFEDVDNDGNLDLILTGNDYGNEIISGRYDAFNGAVLLGNGKGEFNALTSKESGFLVVGDAKSLAKLQSVNGDILIATQNRDSLRVYKNIQKTNDKIKTLNPLPTDNWAELTYEGGQVEKVEFYYGAGYLTQSSRAVKILENVRKIVIHSYDGKSRSVDLESM